MHFLTIFILLAFSLSIVFFFIHRIFPVLIRKKATTLIDVILFPKGLQQKQEAINAFHNITNNRFKNEDILDYYYKIKGLRTLGRKCNRSFVLKKYLFSPTNIKLIYFEQLRFYETFLNFPYFPNNEQQRKNYCPLHKTTEQ